MSLIKVRTRVALQILAPIILLGGNPWKVDAFRLRHPPDNLEGLRASGASQRTSRYLCALPTCVSMNIKPCTIKPQVGNKALFRSHYLQLSYSREVRDRWKKTLLIAAKSGGYAELATLLAAPGVLLGTSN